MLNKTFLIISALLLTLLSISGIAFAYELFGTGATSKVYYKQINSNMSAFIQQDFNNKYGVVSLYDEIGQHIADVSLISNTDECGDDILCEAYMKIDLKVDYTTFIDKVITTKIDKTTPFNIGGVKMFLFNGLKSVNIDDYQTICQMKPNPYIADNMTEICEYDLIGIKKINMDVYIPYNGEKLKAGQYTFKINGTKKGSDSVEWIPTIAGMKINEFALWGPNNLQEILGNSTIDANINAIGAYKYSAFRFNATKNYSIRTVQIYVSETGSLTASTWWGLYPANATRGINTTIIGSNSSSLSSFSAGSSYNFSAVNNDSLVIAGREYWIVFYASGSSQYIRVGETIGSGEGLWAQGATLSSMVLNSGGGTNVVKTANIKIWGAEEDTAVRLNMTGSVVTINERTLIPNATILILNSVGDLIANTTSNATGDWYYTYGNNTIINYTIVGFRMNNTSPEGNAYPFINA